MRLAPVHVGAAGFSRAIDDRIGAGFPESAGHRVGIGDVRRRQRCARQISLEPSANGKSYVMAPARDAKGDLVLILVDEDNGAVYVGSQKGLAPLPRASVTKAVRATRFFVRSCMFE